MTRRLLAAGRRFNGRWYVVILRPCVRVGTGATLAEAFR